MKLKLILYIFLISQVLSGQRPIEIITHLTNPIPTESGDLYEQYQNYSITVINYTDQDQEIYFLADLVSDNGVSITMDRFYKPMESFSLSANSVEVLTAADLEELNSSLMEDDLILEGITQDQLIFGSVPEGNYQLCVNAFDFETGTQLSVSCSMPFFVGSGNVPRIITPFEGEIVPQAEIPVFNISWEFPLSDPMAAMDLNYEVKIVDITQNYDWDLEELFADNGIPVVLEEVVEDGMTNYLYNNFGDDPDLIEGHEYGIRVRAFDPMDEISIQNAGYTEIRRFWYAQSGIVTDTTETDNNIAQNDTLPADCEERCNPLLPSSTTPITDLSQITNIKIGHFYLENYTLIPAGDAFNGDAEITFNFLSDIKVKVDLNNIKINASGEVFEGSARSQLAQEESIQGLADQLRIPDSADPAIDMIPEDQAEQISDILESVRTVSALVGNNAVGLPLGFPVTLKNNEFYLGLTDIILTPEGAKSKVMLSARLALFEGENSLLLTGDSICIHPQGFGGEYIFGLQSDLALVNNENPNGLELFLTGAGTNPDNYCSVQMGCDGLESLNMYGYMEFPRSTLTPVVPDMNNIPSDLKVKAQFGFSIDNTTQEDSVEQSNHINWLAMVDVDRFEITGLKGWQFEVNNAYIDMSDLDNPPNANFPEDYHTSTPDFRGFYMKEAFLSPPAHLLLDSTTISVSDLIIDPAIYGRLDVANVLPIEKGNLAGYGFGIDSLNLHFYDNTLVYGALKGPLQIPITDITDSLKYTALIENTELPGEDAAYMYVFDVGLQDTVQFPFLVANATLYDDSYLDIGFFPSEDEDPFVQTYLHGVLNIDTETFYPESLPELPAHAKMFGMEYSIDYTSGVGFNGDNTYVGFASPQKGLGGFPINLDNFDVGLNANYQTVAVQFNVDISFAKGELDLGAGVQFSLVSNLQSLDALGNIVQDGAQGALNTVKSLRLERIQFDSIYIEVDKGSFGFYGMIAFFNDPLPEGGRNKGVTGELTVTLPVLTVELTAIFGNIGTPPDIPEGQPMVYSEDFFTYWYVTGKVILATGIPIASGVGIYGLGGGVGYNMIQTASSQIVDGQLVGDPVFEPVYNSFRLEFTVIFGTHPEPDAFNADVTFIAQFVNGGLDMIGIEGDGYIMTPITERADPKVYVGVGIYLYAQNQERDWYIDGYLRVAINVNDKFVGNMTNSVVPNQMVDASFYVSAERWYFYAGEPDFNPYDEADPRGSAEFRFNDNLKAEFKAYMMVGHDIPLELPPLPADIQRILDDPSGELEDTESAENVGSQLDGQGMETGSGFAHGSSGSLEASIDAKLIYASLWVCLGYDMNLTQRPYNCANTGERIGINGWYAEGQAYAGIEGNMGVQVKLFGDEPTRFHLFSLAAAIALYGGAPAPAYFGGRGSVYYSVLGGKLEGYETFQFSTGERCAVSPDDPFAGISFIEGVDPGDGAEDIPPYARALVKFTLPMDETLYIPVPVLDANNEVIRVEELGYTPKVSYTLKRNFANNKSVVPTQPLSWVNDDIHDALVIRPQDMFQENRNYKLEIKIRAIDEQTGGYLLVDNKVWSQDTTILFRVGPYPDDLYDMVKYSIPMPYERYYLQDENLKGKIYFTQGLPQDHYFPTTNPFGFGNISYVIRLTNLHDQSEIEVPFSNYSSSPFSPNLEFNLPDLENEKIYALQVVRKGVIPNIGSMNLSDGRIQVVDDEDASMTLNTTVLAPGQIVQNNEFLLYHTYFRTSKYDNMAQKIGGASVSNTELIGSSTQYGKKLKVYFEMEERFEERDFRSFFPNIPYAEDLEFQPRVKMTDICNKPYHNNKAEPKVGGFKEYYENNVYGGIFVFPFPGNLKVDWGGNAYYVHPSSAMNGNFDGPLSDGEVSQLWANYLENGSFSYFQNSGYLSYFNLNTGQYISGNTYRLNYSTHFNVMRDKKTMVNWMNNYLTILGPGLYFYDYWFNSQHPTFMTKFNQLKSTNLKLQNNSGTYGVYFNRNNSHIPGHASWSWFINDIEFSTPPVTFSTTATTLGSASNSGSRYNQFFFGRS